MIQTFGRVLAHYELPLTEFRVQRMIRRVPKDDTGRMRVIASKYIEGLPIGPYCCHCTPPYRDGMAVQGGTQVLLPATLAENHPAPFLKC